MRSGIVLAGGKSSRMGVDKATLAWKSTTMLEHVISLVGRATDEVVAVVDSTDRFPRSELPLVEDLVPGAHALGGLYTGLQSVTATRAFVCACDMPMIVPALVGVLFDHARGFDLAIPEVDGVLHPLCAVYDVRVLPLVLQQLQARQWALKDLVFRVNANVVAGDALRSVDPELTSLMNVNTPDEYERALLLVGCDQFDDRGNST